MKPKIAMGVVLAAALTHQTAKAQNADPFFFGDEAALSSGAVVASGRDSGALWYNPAGFGGLQRGLVSASASTFGLRFRTVPNALQILGQPKGTDFSSVDVISVPNAIVAAAKITDRVALGGGLLITERDVRSAIATSDPVAIAGAGGTPVEVRHRADIQLDMAKYHVGPAVAWAVTNAARLGAALFATYRKRTLTGQYALSSRAGPAQTDPHEFLTIATRETGSAIGLAASFGGQLNVTPEVSLGLTVRTPEIAITASNEGGNVVSVGTFGGPAGSAGNIALGDATDPGLAGKIMAPARVLAGVAYALGPPASFVEVGVDFAHGLPKAADSFPARAPVVNARVGVRYMLSPAWVLGGGVFSDRTTLSDVSKDRVDYYGVTVGVSKRTPLALVKDPTPEALVLVTTLSLRSSIGFGQDEAFVANPADFTASSIQATDVTFFEIMPYLGSAVVF